MIKKTVLGILLVGSIVITDSQFANAGWWDTFGKSDAQKKSESSKKKKVVVKDKKVLVKKYAQEEGSEDADRTGSEAVGAGGGTTNTVAVAGPSIIARPILAPTRLPNYNTNAASRPPVVPNVSTPKTPRNPNAGLPSRTQLPNRRT